MATVEIVQQMKHFNTDALILFLSKQGISQTGLKALRDNQVEGEMLLEFTDADLKDIFEVFKDRFLIRKILRGLYGPNSSACRMGRTIAPSVQTTQVVRNNSITSEGTMPTVSSSTPITVSMSPKINSQAVINQLPSLETYINRNTQPYVSPSVNSVESHSARVKIPTNTVQLFPSTMSTHEKITSRLIAAGKTCSTPITLNNSNNISVYSTPKLLETQTTSVDQSNIKPHVIEDDDDDDDITDHEIHVIDGWGSSRIKDYSAEELLRRKMRRGRPTEAQRLGRSLLREAATTANIWNTAPPLKMITADKKEAFFHYICRAAPQLSRHKQFVWIRLGEALQNRRKYLCDKECGRRITKRRRDSDIGLPGAHLLSPSGDSTSNSIVNTGSTVTDPFSLVGTSLSLPNPTSHSSTPPETIKTKVEPIVIEVDSLLPNSSNQSQPGSPIETINLTTLIKEEVESEEMNCWSES